MLRACCVGAFLILVFVLTLVSVHAHLFWYAWGFLLYGPTGLNVLGTHFAWYDRIGGTLSASCRTGGLLHAASALGAGVCKPGMLPPEAWAALSRSSSAQHLGPLGTANATLLVSDPPIWVIDGLFDAVEAEQMIAIGAVPGRMKAAPAGEMFNDQIRNNKKLYLHEGWGSDGGGGQGISAAEVQLGVPLARRVAALAQVPADHLEELQIQRTLPGEFYKMHHDFDTADLFDVR